MIDKITYYIQGKLTERQALELWVKLLEYPEEMKLLETYLMLQDNSVRIRSQHGLLLANVPHFAVD